MLSPSRIACVAPRSDRGMLTSGWSSEEGQVLSPPGFVLAALPPAESRNFVAIDSRIWPMDNHGGSGLRTSEAPDFTPYCALSPVK